MDVTILSGDRDLLQLATKKVKIAIPKTSKGVTTTYYYYDKDVYEEYLCTPIEFIDVKFSSIGRGCFQAWVPAYVIGKSNTLSPIPGPTHIKCIVFKGDCIDRFMTSKCTVSEVWDYNNNKLQVNIDYNKDKIKEFKYNKSQFSLVPGWKMISAQKDVKNLLTMQTTLRIKPEREMNTKNVIELYKKVEKLFSFICYRQHVEFESIILKQTELVISNGKTKEVEIDFELYISSDDGKYDLPNVGKHMTISDYVSNIPELIKNIDDNDHILLSFPDNELKANIIDNIKYICISSAFESEFDLSYPNFKSINSKNYKEARDKLVDFLDKQYNDKKNTSHVRKYYKSFKAFISKYEGSLEEQILHVLKAYNYIVEPERKFYKERHPNINFDDESLSKSFAEKRNNLSHGSKLEKFKILEVASYVIIRKINYAMMLKRSGFDDKGIQKIIDQVF